MANLETLNQAENDQLLQLFQQYFPIVRALQKKYYIKGFDEDDWSQEGYISLYKAKNAYKPNMGASFGSFFKRTFENNIKSHLRKQNAYKRQIDSLSVSWEDYTQYATSEWTSLYHIPTRDDSLNRLVAIEAINDCINQLPFFSQQILIKILEGKEVHEIANELYVPTKTIRYQVNKIKIKIELFLS